MNTQIARFASLLCLAADAAASGTQEKPYAYTGERKFFPAANAADANAYIQKISDSGMAVTAYAEQWPEKAGVAILPLAKREPVMKDGKATDDKEVKVYGAIAWPFYDLDTVQAHEAGKAKLQELAQAAFAQSILNPLRKQDLTNPKTFDLSGLPVSLEDFLEGMAGDRGVYKAYNEAVKKLLPKIKEKSVAFKHFTAPIIRQFLQSAAIAKSFNVKLEEHGFWLQMIDAIEAQAKKDDPQGNVEIFQRWRDTRNEAQAEIDFENLSLADLSA